MRRFFTTCFILILFFACTDDYDNPIPSYPVYIEVDFQTPRDKDLKGTPSFCVYTPKNKKARESIGFGGVLVVNTIYNEYKAFDLSCPNETNRNVIVEVQDDLNAVCPTCGSKFEVILNSSSGICIGGATKYSLRSYYVIRNGNNGMYVRNSQ